MKKIICRIQFYRCIRVIKYFYLNYFCKNIIRKGKGKIIPYKNAIIDLEKKSRIIIYDEDIKIGLNKLKGSKIETLVRLRENAIWNAKEKCELSYGVTLEILNGAKFDSYYFTMNSYSVLIAAEYIFLGRDVMIGRNVIIYDSDFHQFIKKTKSLPVYIGNHVWLTSNVMVLKGVSIGDNCVIAAGSIITNSIGCNQIVGSINDIKQIKGNVNWIR